MHVPSHPTLIRRMLDSRLKQLVPTGPVLAASLAQVNKRCGQPSCSCHHGARYTKPITSRSGRPERRALSHVPQELLDEVRSWVQEHQRLKAVLHEVSQLTLALIQGHVQDRRRRQGRR